MKPFYIREWERDLQHNFSETQLDHLFRLTHTSSVDTKMQENSFKLLTLSYRVPTRLAKIYSTISKLCCRDCSHLCTFMCGGNVLKYDPSGRTSGPKLSWFSKLMSQTPLCDSCYVCHPFQIVTIGKVYCCTFLTLLAASFRSTGNNPRCLAGMSGSSWLIV